MVIECLDNFSISNLFANLQDRIEFLLPGPVVKEHWKLSGKMFKSLKDDAEVKINSICTLQQDTSTANATYFVNKEIFEADPFLDSILGKLNLMYSTRQTYSIEGNLWKSKAKDDSVLLKCATIYSGSEPVNILIQVQNEEILEKVFPDFLSGNFDKIRIERLENDGIYGDSEMKFYFEIILKSVKINL